MNEIHEQSRWAEALLKIARMTLTIKRDGNWSSFQLANSALPLSVTSSAIAPSARMPCLLVGSSQSQGAGTRRCSQIRKTAPTTGQRQRQRGAAKLKHHLLMHGMQGASCLEALTCHVEFSETLEAGSCRDELKNLCAGLSLHASAHPGGATSSCHPSGGWLVECSNLRYVLPTA